MNGLVIVLGSIGGIFFFSISVFAIIMFKKRNIISNNTAPTVPTVYRHGSSEC
jgi:hypothetical protein